VQKALREKSAETIVVVEHELRTETCRSFTEQRWTDPQMAEIPESGIRRPVLLAGPFARLCSVLIFIHVFFYSFLPFSQNPYPFFVF